MTDVIYVSLKVPKQIPAQCPFKLYILHVKANALFPVHFDHIANFIYLVGFLTSTESPLQ
jgi:hypothetical protein